MTAVLKIAGMTCQNCVRHVREALESAPGVEKVNVSLEPSLATVEGENLQVSALVASVTKAGYTAAPE